MIVESYREQCLDQQIELTYFSTENEVKMDIVPHYVNTIVGNIIENAISYSNDYCKVSVTSQVVGNDLVIKVADNGIGIAPDDLPHVFEPFYRAALAEQMCEGIGIGLTVVRDMVSVLGGSVEVESVPGNGSVFTVVLPLSSHRNEAYGKLEMVVKPVRNVVRKRHDVATDDTVETSQKERADVLVVEDHNDVARLVGAALGPDFGVHYASNGEQGLELAARLMPDLIITDVKMPYVDGLEMCRRVRASRRLRHIPIIMLSARTSEADRIRGIEAGADAYLIKPFSSDELKVWATKLLENRKILRDSYSNTASIMASQNVESISQMDDEELLAAFAELLDERIAGGAARLNLGEIAVQLKMGESQLRHRIQNLTGKNVSAYVTQLRMEKAMRLLHENPTMLIGDIAEQCGFSDVAYFSRVFRQYYKMTPTRARNGSPD
jgi:DNA-binding response OmpR family regulator